MRYWYTIVLALTSFALSGQQPEGEVDTSGVVMDSLMLDSLYKVYQEAGDQSGRPKGFGDNQKRPPEGRGARGQAIQEQSRGSSGSSEVPEGGVEYGSKDSSLTDVMNQQIHLYGEAYVRYDEFEVLADYIVFDLEEREVMAYSRPKQITKPTFTTGDQTVEADQIRYNIDTEQGIVHGARVQQDQLFIHGAVTKFVRAGRDSLHIDDVIYNRNALVTTCNKDHPHWGIRTTKLKFIPEKLAVIGPFDMELGGIPTPLALPFAFAPLFSFGQSTSGLIFPQDPFYNSRQLGIGMRGLGYYFAFSDKMDLRLSADLYTRGSFALTAASNYRKRYKYNGALNFSFSRELRDLPTRTTPALEKSFSISINHRQDAKAHPFRTIGGSLRFTINDYDRRNSSNPNDQLNSQINSNFSYSYKLNNKTTFSTSILHNQNTLSRDISFTLPDMQLRMSRVFPFKRKNSSSSNEAWFEKINVQYNGRFQNSVMTKDTLLFTSQTLKDFRSGVSQEFDVGASYNVLEYFSFNTNVNYDEFWYFQTYRHTEVDTSRSNLAFLGDVVPDFSTLREFSMNANLTTNIFGTLQFAKGKLRGLRHKITPSIGLSYRPSTEGYYEYFDIDPDIQVDQEVQYNPFSGENGERVVFNRSLQRGGASITYSLMNTFEGKVWSKKDSTEKKFKIFNTVNLSGNYNMSADSLNWSPVSFTANAQLFKRKSTLSINGALDPYVTVNNRRVNRTTLSENGKLFRLSRFTASLNTRMSFKDIRDLFRGSLEDQENEQLNASRGSSRARSGPSSSRGGSKSGHPELFSWFEDFSIDHVLRYAFVQSSGKVELQTHSLSLRTGSIPLSDKWGMRLDNISYDFKRKQFVYPSFTLTRDLHCWQMRVSWQPQLDTYTFFIGVSAAPFSNYLKYSTGRNNFDRNFNFR